jgi:hypothetical protein
MISKLDEDGIVYDELSLKQKKFFRDYIWNGVGSRSFFINPHDLIFKNASLYHDFYYWRGGPEEYRIMADQNFLHRSHALIRREPIYRRPFYYAIAAVYVFFLRLVGKVAFEYSERPCQTWEELLDRVNTFYDQNPKITGRPPRYK